MLGSSFSAAPHHILVWYPHIFFCAQVVQPFIDGEGGGGESHVGTLIVPNVATIWDSVVLAQQVEGEGG